jgi:hypothetical protein
MANEDELMDLEREKLYPNATEMLARIFLP